MKTPNHRVIETLLVSAMILASTAAVAQDAYKCKVNGAFVYQDSPCRAVGPAPKAPELPVTKSAPPAAPSPSATAPTDIERNRAYLASREKERRISDLKYEIEQTEQSIVASRMARDAEIASLQQRKGYANNNLAGATLEQSISTEMQAVTARYESDINHKQGRIKQLREDLAKAQGGV